MKAQGKEQMPGYVERLLEKGRLLELVLEGLV